MNRSSRTLTLGQASTRAARIRQLYHQLEEENHWTRWSTPEDIVGFLYDVGELGRLVMAKEGRWIAKGNVPRQLEEKLAECLWWLFALSDRVEIDLNRAFLAKLKELESRLSQSIARRPKRRKLVKK